MQVLDAKQIEALRWSELVEVLRDKFASSEIAASPWQSVEIPLPRDESACLLLMPAWQGGEAIG